MNIWNFTQLPLVEDKKHQTKLHKIAMMSDNKYSEKLEGKRECQKCMSSLWGTSSKQNPEQIETKLENIYILHRSHTLP